MHVVDSLGNGGLENGLANLIERLNPDKFEHVICAIRELGVNAERLAGRAELLCLGKKEHGPSIQVGALARTIRNAKPDIVHSRNWAAIEAVIAARYRGSCAVVHSEHGLDAVTLSKDPWRRICFRRVAFELAHRVLSVSYQLRALHSSRTGFPARKITVIHNGVDSRKFFPDASKRDRARKELGISANEFCVGCVGNLFAVKDHMTVLNAMARFNKTFGDWRLILIGHGPELPKLEQFLSMHPQCRQRVCFLGSSNRVPELLNGLDVYVLPSLTEGISNSLLEAMATGLPVVVTATGGNPEVVVDGESGVHFPVGDHEQLSHKLQLLRTREDLRRQLAQKSLSRIRGSFSLDSMIRNYERLYEGVVAGGLVRKSAGT